METLGNRALVLKGATILMGKIQIAEYTWMISLLTF